MTPISIYEVGPRDGLQNWEGSLTTDEKISLINDLYDAGLTEIEITSFVHPKRVPNLADAENVVVGTKGLADFGVLVPNLKGFERAKDVGATRFNVCFSPSEEFNVRNWGKRLDVLYAEYAEMLNGVDKENVRVYVSCAFGCPYEGLPNEYKMLRVLKMASELGNTVVLCDTVGACYPSKLLQTLELTRGLPVEIALHLHEGANDMFRNVEAAIEWGVTTFDASVGGLGGCPFMPNSGNNLSTNRLIEWAHSRGYQTGVNLAELTRLANWLKNKVEA